MKLHYTPTQVQERLGALFLEPSLDLSADYLCEDYLQLWGKIERLQAELAVRDKEITELWAEIQKQLDLRGEPTLAERLTGE